MLSNSIKKIIRRGFWFFIVGSGLLNFSCLGEGYSLYEDIATGIVSAQAYSHDDQNYTPVPDSLRLRFQPQLRMLRSTVLTSGCGPQLEARLEVSPTRMTIRFDMHDTCVHVRPEYFDVDIFVSPVHPDTFQLVIEQVDFSRTDVSLVLLNRRIDVRTLPKF